MRLVYRVLGEDGCHRDVRADVADAATVGDVALAIRAHATTGSVGEATQGGPADVTIVEAGGTAVPVDPSAPASVAAPRSGSTIRVVSAPGACSVPPHWSPVVLRGIHPAGRAARLAYGSTNLGAARIHVGDDVTVHTTGEPDRVELDGTPVLGAAGVDRCSILRVGDATFSLDVEGPLRAPTAGPLRHHRCERAIVEHHEPVTVELPAPPAADRAPGFPMLSAVVPLLMGAAMWMATRSLMVAGFALFSVAFVVASGIEIRREHRRDRRFRERTFEADLATAADRARTLRDDERRRSERDHPSGPEVAAWVDGDLHRVWERRPAHRSPLQVRVGFGPGRPVDPVRVPDGGREDLRARLVEVAGRLDSVDGPVTVDMSRTGLGIAGTGEAPASLARAVVAQLVATVGPEHLCLTLDASVDRAAAWGWLNWLPHDLHVAGTGPSAPAPDADDDGRFRIIVVDRSEQSRTPSVSDTGGVIVVAGSAAALPDGLGAVVVVGRDAATIRRDDGPPDALTPDGLQVEACERLARALTPLRPGGGDLVPVPDAVTLQDVLADPDLLLDDDAVLAAWERSRSERSRLGAPIGHSGGGVIHVDLRADGPHGLVAGTTGSGKSELLRTLVATLALHHPPDRVTFLLVDYKGGAAFRAVADLPHVVGVVSDLGPTGARRAITSLRAEIRNRELLVAEADAGDLDGLGEAAPPALVVVVDEFATLTNDLPDVMDGLLDVAQRGRSLGIHLLLSTQRPNGVVTDAMRANLSLRLALRVADEDDSRDVVDGPDAAHIPAGRVGRAILRLGPTGRAVLQVAGTSSPVRNRSAVRCAPLTGPDGADPGPPGPSQLEHVVERCRGAAAGSAPPPRPWVDPLPDHLDGSTLPGPGRPGALVVGLLDRPHEQRHVPAEIDLDRCGGVLVVGAARSGRTTALGAVARAAVSDVDRSTIVYAIDGNGALDELIGTTGPGGSVEDVVMFDDAERVLRLLRTLRARCRGTTPADLTQAEGTPGDGTPGDGTPGDGTPGDGTEAGGSESERDGTARVVLMIDGVGALVEHHENVNRGEAADLLAAIAADGPANGVHVVATARRLSEVPPTIAHALDRRIVLRCASADDAAALDTPTDLAMPDLPPGRGRIDGELVQITAPPATTTRPATATRGREGGLILCGTGSIGRLPRTVPVGDLPGPADWKLPIGVRADDLGTAVLDLTHQHALVIGPPRSGRSTALDTITHQILRSEPDADVVRLQGHRPDDAVELLRAVLDADGGPTPQVVVIDDLPELLEGPDGASVEELVGQLLRPSFCDRVRVVASGESDALTRCYGEAVRRLRSGRTGILLRPDPDLHPGLLHTVLPRHDEFTPAPGRGWIVTPDGPSAVQLAR